MFNQPISGLWVQHAIGAPPAPYLSFAKRKKETNPMLMVRGEDSPCATAKGLIQIAP